MIDDTQQKIINATMELIKDKGYSATTTKDIANFAKVNECTIFRKFKSKKDIVIYGLEQSVWNPNISEEIFEECVWDLKTDLIMFSNKYLEKVTPELVKLSIGLRSPQIYDNVKDKIMQIPEVFKKALKEYFESMYQKGKIAETDFDFLATMFLSINFGFIFLKASFEDKLTVIGKQQYVEESVDVFIIGIKKK